MIGVQNIKRMWHYRWAILTAIMTAAGGTYALLPIQLQPDVPGWGKWCFALLGFISALHTAMDHVRDNRNKPDTTDGAGA